MRKRAYPTYLLRLLFIGAGLSCTAEQLDVYRPITGDDIGERSWRAEEAIEGDPIPLAPNEALANEILRLYEGSWEGKMQLSSIEGKRLHEFVVQQEYWWGKEGKVLKGLAVFDDEGMLRYAQSDSYIKDGVLYSKVEENHEEKLYKARIELKGPGIHNPEMKDYQIIWMPMQRNMTLDHQVEVTFENSEEGFVMHNKGYERYTQGSVETWIMLNGDLVRKSM